MIQIAKKSHSSALALSGTIRGTGATSSFTPPMKTEHVIQQAANITASL